MERNNKSLCEQVEKIGFQTGIKEKSFHHENKHNNRFPREAVNSVSLVVSKV